MPGRRLQTLLQNVPDMFTRRFKIVAQIRSTRTTDKFLPCRMKQARSSRIPEVFGFFWSMENWFLRLQEKGKNPLFHRFDNRSNVINW